MKFLKREKGFTLIELLVVVSIIGVLATIVLSSLGEARENAKEKRFIAEIRSLQNALEIYHLDNNEYPNRDDGNTSNPDFTYLTSISPGYPGDVWPEFISKLEPYMNVEAFSSSMDYIWSFSFYPVNELSDCPDQKPASDFQTYAIIFQVIDKDPIDEYYVSTTEQFGSDYHLHCATL